MYRLFYFATGWLSTFSITNMFDAQNGGAWQETLVSLIGGVCSTVFVAWLRWRWEKRNSRRQ